jgi:hypothetical protein
MAFPTSITAVQYSAITVAKAAVPGTLNEANLKALFPVTANAFLEIKNLREMPSFGSPANIVKVPTYGQGQSQSIGAQSDAPDLELTVNFVAGDWAKAGVAFTNASATLGDGVADGVSKVFMVSLLNSKPTSLAATATGIGAVPNATIYFVGKMESLLINPSLDDAMTATVALSIQSDFYGPYTIASS